MEANRYNLRSNRRERSIPVQLQLATDEDFMMASRSRMESAQARQVFSELSDSESDIDISDFTRSSDQNLSLIASGREYFNWWWWISLAPRVRVPPPLIRHLLTKKFCSN